MAGSINLSKASVVDASREREMTEGDAEYDLLFTIEFPAVMRTVYLILHEVDRAEDITQDAFVALLRNWKKVSRYERPGAWVRRVAIRLAIESLRRDRLRSILERQVEPPRLPEPAQVDVMRAIRDLPARQRAVVILFYFEDRPIAEIADLLGCSESTARVHLHRARHHLADSLGGEVSDDVF
jgi:RNA polymerase sigma-70 factor, ECF subfamily